MITAAIAGFIVILILRVLEKGEDRGIDSWVSVIFVLVPALLIFLLSFGIGMLGLLMWLFFVLPAFYFVIPPLMAKFQFGIP